MFDWEREIAKEKAEREAELRSDYNWLLGDNITQQELAEFSQMIEEAMATF